MSTGLAEAPLVERLLAGLLQYGTWLASAVTAVGLALAFMGPANRWGMRIVTSGIAFFILLPVLRVILMLAVFIRERDYRFAAIAATVLTIILAGLAVGAHMAKSLPHA